MSSIIDNTYSATEDILADDGFFAHLTAYLAVNALLIIINLLTTPQVYWFVWPLFGWGIGIVAHGIVTYFDRSSRRRR